MRRSPCSPTARPRSWSTPRCRCARSQELIDYAKANPGKLSYGSAGNGSITNLAGELFKLRAGGLDIVHVPYKGIGQGVTDLIGGQIPMFSANATAQILDLHRAGKARILSVNSQTRIRSAPDIPTSIEAGLPGMVAQTTFGIFAPAGTPRPILERINAVTQEAMADEAFQNELLGRLRAGARRRSRQGGGGVPGRARALDADPQDRQHETGMSAACRYLKPQGEI